MVTEGGYYKQEQQEIVSGLDGSHRWNNFLSVVYGGMPPLMQYCFVKFLLDQIPAFRNVYYSNSIVKIHVDMFASYGIMALMLIGNASLEYITLGIIVSAYLMHCLSDKPIFVNILTKPNPNPTVSIKLNEKSELTSVRIQPVTHFKASTMLITVLAIMAVDYPLLFERYLCKSEDHGWALMDVGVSAVMFSSGYANKLIV